MTSDELLDALIGTLERIRRLLPITKQQWDTDETTRLAVERLWIEAGNTAEEYRRSMRIELGIDPWSELYEYRNRLAHALPGDVDPDRVWHDARADLDNLIAELRHQHN